jgi:hypothetical protein
MLKFYAQTLRLLGKFIKAIKKISKKSATKKNDRTYRPNINLSKIVSFRIQFISKLKIEKTS